MPGSLPAKQEGLSTLRKRWNILLLTVAMEGTASILAFYRYNVKEHLSI